MRTRWKFMGAVLTVVMILTSLSMTVFADNPIETGSVQGQFSWELYMDGTMRVTAYTNHINLADITDGNVKRAVDRIEFDISQPASNPSTKYIRIEGRGVWAKELEYIGGENRYYESVSIYMLQNLKTIDFPEGAQIQSLVITGAAFDNIDFLDDLNVERIWLKDCDYLLNVSVPAKIKNSVIDECSCLEAATILSKDTQFFFPKCENLSEVSIPNGVTKIAYQAFEGCDSLIEVKLPTSVREIGTFAFYDSGLEKINIPDGVSKIEYGTFMKADLRKVKLPSSVKEIGPCSFMNNTRMTSINIPSGVTAIQYATFSGCASL